MSSNALLAFLEKIRPQTKNVILANRQSGPDKIMSIVEDRCSGVFDDIENVISNDDLSSHPASYKSAAGFCIQAPNASPSTIDTGSLY